MKEFFEIIFSFNLNKIFREPTKNAILQFFRYAFVGGIATIVDWAVFYTATVMGLYYMISGVLAFGAGLFVNFVLSKKFVFSGEKNKHSASTEFVVYAIIGIIGLLLTEIIMFLLTEKLGLYFMIPKVIATAAVFVWNFAARKVVLYGN